MKLKESEDLELKKSTSELKEAVISIAAILNKHGKGRLYFGVRNDGAVVGQTVSAQTLRDVSRAVFEGVEPRIYPQVEKVRLAGKDCVKVSFSGNDGPYLAHGRAYMRVADEDRQLSVREMQRLFVSRIRDGVRWEAEPSDRKLSEVNGKVLREFMKRANIAGRIGFRFAGVRNTLNKLGLLAKGKLRRAGDVLFCDENQLEIQAAVFAGTDKLTFLDIKLFKGNIFDLLEQAETYVKAHMDWKVEFGGLQRKEIPEIPIDALREALVNSLCHRDYLNPKGNEIAIFKDRVEIYNPGDFPEGYKPEDFIKGTEHSILRNPLIAEALFKCKDIERWGSGLKRIADECAQSSVKVQFHVRKSGFVVAFTRRPAKTARVTPQVAPQATTQADVTDLEAKLLTAIAKSPKTSRSQIARKLGISPNTVKEYIKKLKAKGLVRRVGKTSAGYWEVVG